MIVLYIILGEFKDVEKTTTILFSEDIPKSRLGRVSGFVTFVSGGGERNVWFYISWILTLGIFIFIFVFVFKKAQVRKWKKQKEVKRIFEIIKETKRDLKKKDVDTAKIRYIEAKEIYSKIPKNCKKSIYKDILKLQTEIDKLDVISLIKELIQYLIS